MTSEEMKREENYQEALRRIAVAREQWDTHIEVHHYPHLFIIKNQ